MPDPAQEELERLRLENERLRRYRDAIQSGSNPRKKLLRMAAFLWFGPNLVRAVHNWINARSAGDALPIVETADLVAVLVRRISRGSLVAVIIASLPVAFLIWQNMILSDQLAEERKQGTELVIHNRKADLRNILVQIEAQMTSILDQTFDSSGDTIANVMGTNWFRTECQEEDRSSHVAVHEVVDNMIETAYPYVRYLSELYLLDIRALDPLSGTISEEAVRRRGAATSTEVYWPSYKIADVMRTLETCRPRHFALFQLVHWNSELQPNEFNEFMIRATEIKYKYDIAKRNIEIGARMQFKEHVEVVVQLRNTSPRTIVSASIYCLIARGMRDVASKSTTVSDLKAGKERTLRVSFPDLTQPDINGASAQCRVDSAVSADSPVSPIE